MGFVPIITGIAGVTLFASLAMAEPVAPLPKPKPAPMKVSQATPALTGTVPPVVGTAATVPPPPPLALPGPLGKPVAQTLNAAALTPEQKTIVEKVNGYFNAITQLTGDFVQIGPDGNRTEGAFQLLKPGRLYFRYAAPSPIELVADGSAVVVRDRRLNTKDLYPLGQTPLRFLLQSQIDLLKDTNVVALQSDPDIVSVVIEERSAIGGTARLTLMFGAEDGQLRQWTITDAQGFDTAVAVYNLDTARKPDARLFKIDPTRDLVREN